MTTPRPDDRDRYITCRLKMNGEYNGKVEILDTHIDGGEGEPLIVALFHDSGEADFFCKAANKEWRRMTQEPPQEPDDSLSEDRCSECGARSLNAICPECQEEHVRILNDQTRSHAL